MKHGLLQPFPIVLTLDRTAGQHGRSGVGWVQADWGGVFHGNRGVEAAGGVTAIETALKAAICRPQMSNYSARFRPPALMNKALIAPNKIASSSFAKAPI